MSSSILLIVIGFSWFTEIQYLFHEENLKNRFIQKNADSKYVSIICHAIQD